MFKYCQQTLYPEIFRGSYWANATGRLDEQIIVNRNRFVERFDIVCRKNISQTPKYILKQIGYQEEYSKNRELDHLELYQTRKKDWIIIASPYLANVEFMEKYGYKKYDNLYSENAETYCKVMMKERDKVSPERRERHIVARGTALNSD